MNDASLVCMLHRVAHPRHQIEPLSGREPLPLGVVPQRRSADEFHREVRLLPEARIRGSHLVDLGDARVVQACQDLDSARSGAIARAWPDRA